MYTYSETILYFYEIKDNFLERGTFLITINRKTTKYRTLLWLDFDYFIVTI